jgi:hypothetical protein
MPVSMSWLPRFRFLVWLCCFLCAGLILVLPQRVLSVLSPVLVIWVTFAVLLSLAAIGFFEARLLGQNAWVAPVTLVSGYYFFRYGWGSIVAYYWDQFPFEFVPGLKYAFWRRGVRENIGTASPLILLCGIGLYLGVTYLSPYISRHVPKLTWVVSESKFRRSVILYAPIGLIVCGVLSFLVPAEVRFVIQTLGSISSVLTVIVSYWCFSAPTHSGVVRWGAFLIAYTAGSMILGLGSGMVGDFVHPLVYALLGYVLARGTYPWKFLTVSFLLGFFVILPWLTIYKYYGQANRASLAVGERISNTQSMMSWLGYSAAMELTLERGIARLSGSWLPATFVQYYPDVYPFEQGRTFALEASTLIPRILWPEKPDMSAELNRYSMSTGIVREAQGTSAVFDAVSEYYVNFGRLGVAILSIVHGCYFGILYQWLTKRLQYIIGVSIFLVLFFENTDFFGVGQLVVSHLKVVSVWLLLLYWMSSVSKQSGGVKISRRRQVQRVVTPTAV